MPALSAPSHSLPADWTAEEWDALLAALTRRRLIGTGLALGLLTACGTGAPATPTAPAAAYPRDVEDTSGTVRIAAAPARIATITNTYELDALLALGVAPIYTGVRLGLGSFTGGDTVSWPWHEEALARLGAKPERMAISTAEPPIERVALTRPDLILQSVTGANAAATEQYRQFATVLTLSNDWRRNLRIVGRALDKLALAEKLVAETDQKIARALDGLGLGKPTVTIAYPQNDGTILAFAHPADARVDLFQRAGFLVSPALAAEATAEKAYVTVSIERTNQLDADLIVVLAYQPAGTETWLNSPLTRGLTAVQKGKVLRIEQGAVAQGMAFFGPLNADAVLPTVRRAGELVKS